MKLRQLAQSLLDFSVAAFLLLYTIVPVLVIGWLAITDDWGKGFDASFTLSWFTALPDRFIGPLWLSIRLAAATTVLTVLVTVTTAFSLVTKKVRATRLVDVLMMAPLSVSYVVLGLALLVAFRDFPIRIYGTFSLLLIGHLIICLPLSYRIVLAVMESIDPAIIEAARSLGASEQQALRRVVLPAIAPSIVAGSLLAFITSLQNFGMSLMVSTPNLQPLPLTLVGFVFSESGAFSNYNLACAVSLMLVAIIMGLLLLVRIVTRQSWFENLNM